MKVLVDTSIWSIALRRKDYSPERRKLIQLIDNFQVAIIGPIRQELLSGIKHQAQFEKLRKKLSYFPDIPIVMADYEKAAEFFNTCRSKGIQGSHVDFLICAVAHSHQLPIFSTDKDFQHYRKHLPVTLLEMEV